MFSKMVLVVLIAGLSCKTTLPKSKSLLSQNTQFDCLRQIQIYSQGHSSEFEWPGSYQEARNTEVGYIYAMVIYGSTESVSFLIETGQGRVYELLNLEDLDSVECPDFAQMGCIKFQLPFPNAPVMATRFQVFDDEGIVTFHEPVTSEETFTNFHSLTAKLMNSRPRLVETDIRLRLSRVQETVEILSANQDDEYIDEIRRETETISAGCLKSLPSS